MIKGRVALVALVCAAMIGIEMGVRLFIAPASAQTKAQVSQTCAPVTPSRYTVTLPSGVKIQVKEIIWYPGKDKVTLKGPGDRIFCNSF